MAAERRLMIIVSPKIGNVCHFSGGALEDYLRNQSALVIRARLGALLLLQDVHDVRE
jgi:hypothetical protein